MRKSLATKYVDFWSCKMRCHERCLSVNWYFSCTHNHQFIFTLYKSWSTEQPLNAQLRKIKCKNIRNQSSSIQSYAYAGFFILLSSNAIFQAQKLVVRIQFNMNNTFKWSTDAIFLFGVFFFLFFLFFCFFFFFFWGGA